MKKFLFLWLGLVACSPKIEVTLLSLAGANDPVLSRLDFVVTTRDRTAAESEQKVTLPRVETLGLPPSFEGQLLHIEAIAFIGGREVGRGATDVAPGQVGATILFALCSNGAKEADELCDDGNLTDGDGCDSTCKPTGCNSDVFTEGEVCFSAQNPVVANAPPSNVLVEDTNGDQLLDIIASYPTQGRVRVFFGSDDNQFGDFFEVNVNTDARLVSVADLNQDSVFDFVVATKTTFLVFTGRGDGTFSSGQGFLAGQDLRGLALADLDGDQFPEQITLDFGQSLVRTLPSLGDGTFDLSPSNVVTVGVQPIALSIVDIDQDGDNDVITANFSGSISVLNNNNGTLTATPEIPTNGTPIAISTADFNGDGKLDIAVTKQAGVGFVSIFKQINPENFQQLGNFAAPNNPRGLIAADVDLDGDADIAVTSQSGATVTILVNNGQGQFPQAEPINTTTSPKAIAAGDINRDGLLDFVTAGQDLGIIFSTP
jgi:cysteine-rich repeat protein